MPSFSLRYVVHLTKRYQYVRLIAGEVSTVEQLAQETGFTATYVKRIL